MQERLSHWREKVKEVLSRPKNPNAQGRMPIFAYEHLVDSLSAARSAEQKIKTLPYGSRGHAGWTTVGMEAVVEAERVLQVYGITDVTVGSDLDGYTALVPKRAGNEESKFNDSVTVTLVTGRGLKGRIKGPQVAIRAVSDN